MVKHTQTICRLLPTNCLSVFDHFVGLALNELNCVLEILKMTWCVAVGCCNNSFKKNIIKGISFYQLPKNKNLKKKMASKYQGSEFTKKSIKICHWHFEGCFKRDLEVIQINSS